MITISEGQRVREEAYLGKLEAQLAALSWAHWIPVSERLPEEGVQDKYLIRYGVKKKDGTAHKGRGFWHEVSWYYDGQWSRVRDSEWSVVTHWMPLPPPPEPR